MFDIDRRLGSIICAAFDDCSSVENQFKLLAIAGNLIERPMIKAKFDPKYQMLLEAFDRELDQVKIIFDSDKVCSRWLMFTKSNYMYNILTLE